MIIHKCIIYGFGDSCTHLQTWIGTHRLRCSCKTLHTHLQIPTATIIASISPPRHQGANHRPHYHSIHYGLYYDSIHYWPYYNSTHYRPDNHSTHHRLYYHSTHYRLYWWDTPFSWVDWRIRWGDTYQMKQTHKVSSRCWGYNDCFIASAASWPDSIFLLFLYASFPTGRISGVNMSYLPNSRQYIIPMIFQFGAMTRMFVCSCSPAVYNFSGNCCEPRGSFHCYMWLFKKKVFYDFLLNFSPCIWACN